MATLTPDIAQNLIWRSMATGVPTTEFDKYGGYEAVHSLYQSTGGQMSLNAIPTDLRNELAQTVAQTGSGNLSILKETGTPLTTEGAANMVRNGLDPANIDRFVESGIPFAEGALDAAKFATSTGGYSEAASKKHA
jgi:hypothetical protein